MLSGCKRRGTTPHLLRLLFLELDFALWVTVEEEIGHDVPWEFARDGSSETEDLAGQEPQHQADGVGRLVVAGDGDVDEPRGRVDVGEGDDGDVGVRALGHGLVVSAGIGDNQQPGLAESSLDLIGEGSCKTKHDNICSVLL